MREQAKWFDKKVKQQQELWEGGGGYGRMLGRKDWEDLLHQRGEAWDVAEEESWKTGFPFNDRDGKRRNNELRDLVGLALMEYCPTIGVRYR